MRTYSLRDMLQADFDFYRELHRATLKPYVAQVWGWVEEQQNRLLKERFNPSKMNIIQVNGEDIGVLQVEERAEDVLLGNILIHPSFQGQGLGSLIITDVVNAAAPLPVSLSVLRPNPARQLYERLGFQVTSEEPERLHMTRNHQE